MLCLTVQYPVFDRVVTCGPNTSSDPTPPSGSSGRVGGALAPPDLPSAVADAYLLSQEDLDKAMIIARYGDFIDLINFPGDIGGICKRAAFWKLL